MALTVGSDDSSGAVRELLLFCAVLTASRLIALACIAWFTGSTEFSMDAELHLRFLRDPLFLMLGDNELYGQYPPLMPVVEALLGYPLQLVFNDFIAIRLTFIAFEIAAGVFVALTVMRLVDDRRFRFWIYAAFILIPAGFLTSVFMAQEEVISELILAVMVWLVVTKRLNLAALAGGIGVVTGKIFFLVPLAALIGMLPLREWKRPVLLALSSIVICYGIMSINALIRGNPLPLVGFAPDTPSFSVAIWTAISTTVYELPPDFVRRASAIAALILGLMPLALLRLRGAQLSGSRSVVLMTAMLLWVFFAFYHINAPYYLLPVPLLLPFARSVGELVLIGVALSIPYGAKIFGAVVRGLSSDRASSKPFIEMYQSVFGGIEPSVIFGMMLWGSVLATLLLAVLATRRVLSERAWQ